MKCEGAIEWEEISNRLLAGIATQSQVKSHRE